MLISLSRVFWQIRSITSIFRFLWKFVGAQLRKFISTVLFLRGFFGAWLADFSEFLILSGGMPHCFGFIHFCRLACSHRLTIFCFPLKSSFPCSQVLSSILSLYSEQSQLHLNFFKAYQPFLCSSAILFYCSQTPFLIILIFLDFFILVTFSLLQFVLWYLCHFSALLFTHYLASFPKRFHWEQVIHHHQSDINLLHPNPPFRFDVILPQFPFFWPLTIHSCVAFLFIFLWDRP